MSLDKLSWGLTYAVPEDAVAAWGARAIFEKRSSKPVMDLLHDRQGYVGPDEGKKQLVNALNKGALKQAQDKFAKMVDAGEIRFDSEKDVVFFEDDAIKIVGNPRGSHGYVYLAAWLKPQEEKASG